MNKNKFKKKSPHFNRKHKFMTFGDALIRQILILLTAKIRLSNQRHKHQI